MGGWQVNGRLVAVDGLGAAHHLDRATGSTNSFTYASTCVRFSLSSGPVEREQQQAPGSKRVSRVSRDPSRTASRRTRLRDVVARTGFSKGLCFRLLHTLHHCGFLEKVDVSRYRPTFELRRRQRYRIGYASQGKSGSFPRDVHAGLVRAAEQAHVELTVVDNRYQPKVALRNADQLVREKLDLVVEFQTDESVAPAIAAKYLEPASR